MKNKMTILGIIALTAIIGFSMTACPEVCDHDWQWEITTYPTAIANGEETRTCSLCEEVETQPITPSDFKSFFMGSWINTIGNTSSPSTNYAPYVVTVTETEITRVDKDGDFIKYTNVQWQSVTANNVSTTTYPTGYTFTGTRTDQNYPGVNYGFISISADKQTLYYTQDASTMYVVRDYTKQ